VGAWDYGQISRQVDLFSVGKTQQILKRDEMFIFEFHFIQPDFQFNNFGFRDFPKFADWQGKYEIVGDRPLM
jgi:hypothetical protein